MNDAPLPIDPAALQLLQRNNLLRSLVQRLVVEEAVGNEPLSLEEQQQALQAFHQQAGLQNEAARDEYLKVQGLRPEDLVHQAELPLRMRRYCQEHYGPKAEAHFLTRKNQLDRVVYSLLRVRDGFLARELYLRIAAREANFADLAGQYSEGPEKATKGVVGPVPLTQAHPQLAERLRTSPPGLLLEPFAIAEWWLVVRLESYTPASFDAAIAQQMAAELMDQWVQQETTRKIGALCNQDEGVPSVPA
ncbi:peptidylprolyl isomerase [Synechococcus sp. CS-1328]|uniref:peptidylprolyl isomerase n=1 Tax=Synechococcus sp. CS-1328 TaxID=2847976 RepID=UPI00223BD2A9|nr:peptidylprolyl isomerase [Synechococcus sp. CS-1328]MCT0224984.1 peptidylprolyl isomerase [Synechococcus sp. CS-1328]